MAEAADQNKDMEDRVVEPDLFEAVQDRTGGICDATGDKPEQAF